MADVGVRPARGEDAEDLARIQAAVWTCVHRGGLPAEVLAAAGSPDAVAQWRAAAGHPPSPRHHVLTATAGDRVVGFAALTPAGDPDTLPALDGELIALHVDPQVQGAGHGSRLVNAVADVARDDGVHHLHAWLADAEVALRKFLVASGWDYDGATRELDLTGDGQLLVGQARLRTALVEP
ncbi:MAG TPA: GNAT family N-acetyltransferase [Actinomycetes bacterium]|jgi:GNAT superfamily N-acetyltransferase